MKKLTGLLALTGAICCAAGLAACNDGNNEDNKLSADEFSSKIETAFQGGYTFRFSYPNEKTSVYGNGTLEADVANSRYLVTYPGNGTNAEKLLFAKEGTEYVQYTSASVGQEATYWNKSSYTKDDFDKLTASRGITAVESEKLSDFLNKVFKDKYDSFTYDGEKDSYLAQNVTVANAGTAKSVSVQFTDGKPSAVDVKTFEEAVNPAALDFTCTKFGATSVTLPTAEYIVAPKMTADEWKECINGFGAATNLTVEVGTGSNSTVMKLNGGTYYELDEHNNYEIYDKVGDKYYVYSASASNRDEENPIFSKKETDETRYNDALSEFRAMIAAGASSIVNRFDSFQYKNNVYSASFSASDNMELIKGYTVSDMHLTVLNGNVAKVECYLRSTANPLNHTQIIVSGVGTTEIKFNAIPDSPLGHTFLYRYNSTTTYTLTIGADGKLSGTHSLWVGPDGYGTALDDYKGDKALIATVTSENTRENIVYLTFTTADGSWSGTMEYLRNTGVIYFGSNMDKFVWQPAQN